jgi:ferredoxin
VNPTRRLVARIDQDFCMGAACCVDAAPHLFRLNEDRVAEWIGDDVDAPAELLAAVEAACPQAAIRIVDAGS